MAAIGNLSCGRQSHRQQGCRISSVQAPCSQSLWHSKQRTKKPTAPTGTKNGYAGRSYTYTSYSSDPNRDLICYTFDWGDGSTSKTSYANSGLRGSSSHAWSRPGSYRIRVIATDSRGASSSWSEATKITISAGRSSSNASFDKKILPLSRKIMIKKDHEGSMPLSRG